MSKSFAGVSFWAHTHDSSEYELDSDDLDDTAIAQLQTEQRQPPRSRREREQAMPLLVGLLDSATARRSVDGTLQLENRGMFSETEEEVDLEELAAKRTAGGGLLDSVANMANSILGAGEISAVSCPASLTYVHLGIIGNVPFAGFMDRRAHSSQVCHTP